MNDKKNAIIVGATSGIGLEVARLLAQKGWTLAIAGRREELLKKISEEIPQVKCYKAIDITVPEADGRLNELIEELGGMTLYFHSSGIGYQNMVLETQKELSTTETNVVGFTRMMDFAFHYFEQHPEINGHIAAISSIAGTKGLGAAPAYSATKRFQNHYLECLTQLAKMKKMKLSITDIRPGFVATDLIKGGYYPLQLNAVDVAKEIVYAIEKKKSIRIIDWKYRILVFFWKLIPRWLWVRLTIKTQ
jgi:short-subunit dehydrogenase